MTYSVLVSFEEIVNRFYDEAKRNKIDMYSKLNFMLKITDNTDDIKCKVNMRVKKFMTRSEMDDLFDKVPKDINIETNVNAINVGQENISEINHQIYLMLRSRATINQFKGRFIDSYYNWKRNSLSKRDIQRVGSGLNSITSKFNELRKKFNTYIKAVNELREKNKSDMNFFLFEIISNEKSNLTVENFNQRFKPILDKIVTEQSQLIKNLANARDSLREYNGHRVKWAEFIIGSRQTLTSDPKLVKSTSSLECVKHLALKAKACFGRKAVEKI